MYKRQGPDEGMDAGEGLSAEPEHKKVQYIAHQKNHTLYQSKTFFSDALFLVFSVGGFRGHRQTKESRKYQQLQLQGGKGGNYLTFKNG